MGLDDFIDQIDWENDEWPELPVCQSCFYGIHEGCPDLMQTGFGLVACYCDNGYHN